jgi:hypothetical protein
LWLSGRELMKIGNWETNGHAQNILKEELFLLGYNTIYSGDSQCLEGIYFFHLHVPRLIQTKYVRKFGCLNGIK